MKDFLGQDINSGDTVVYPGRQGSNMWMNSATVLDLLDNSIRVQRTKDGAVRVLNRLDRVVVVHQIKRGE